MTRLFISHSSKDNATAMRLHTHLMRKGWGPVFLDIHPEYGMGAGNWVEQLSRASQRCRGIVYLISNDWLDSENCRAEYTFAEFMNSQASEDKKAIIPARTEEIDLSRLPGQLPNIQLTPVPETEIELFENIERQLTDYGLAPEAFNYNPENKPDYLPFPGLRALEGNDAAVFFGRETEIQRGLELVDQAAHSRGETQFVSIRGGSSVGKSSLLEAGLLPRLKRKSAQYFVLDRFVPVSDPFSFAEHGRARRSFVSILLDGFRRSGENEIRRSEISDAFESTANTVAVFQRLLKAARQTSGASPEATLTLILPIDQAEDFISLDSEALKVFRDRIGQVLDLVPEIVVLSCSRADKLAELQALSPFSGRSELELKLQPIPREYLSEIIGSMAQAAEPPIAIEPGLLASMLSDIDSTMQAPGDPLCLISVSLHNMLLNGRDVNRLCVDDYKDIGGASGVVQSLVSKTSADSKISEAALVNAVVPSMIDLQFDGQPLRRVVQGDEVSPKHKPAIDALMSARIISQVGESDKPAFTVSHSAFLRLWPKLQMAINEERLKLESLRSVVHAATVWRNGATTAERKGALIHGGRRLKTIRNILKSPTYSGRFSNVISRYLSACAKKERKKRVRVVTGAGLLVALLAGGYSANSTMNARSWALTQATTSTPPSAKFAIAAVPPPGAILPDVSGVQGCDVGMPTTKSACALRMSGAANEIEFSFSFGTGNAIDAELSKDEKAIAVSFGEPVASVAYGTFTDPESSWNVTTLGQPIGTLFSGQNELVVVDRSSTLSQFKDGRLIESKRLSENQIARTMARIDPDRIVLGMGDGSIQVASLSQFDALTGPESYHAKYIDHLRPYQDAKSLISFDGNGRGAIWNTDDWSLITRLTMNDRRRAASLEVTAGDEYLLAGSVSGPISVWNLETFKRLQEVRLHASPVTIIQSAESSGLVASGDESGSIWVWNVETREKVAGPLSHADAITSLAFVKSDTQLLSSSKDGLAKLWDIASASEITRLSGTGPVILSAYLSQTKTAVVVGEASGLTHIRTLDPIVELNGRALRDMACTPGATRYHLGAFTEAEIKDLADHRWPRITIDKPCAGEAIFGLWQPE